MFSLMWWMSEVFSSNLQPVFHYPLPENQNQKALLLLNVVQRHLSATPLQSTVNKDKDKRHVSI